MPPCPTPDQLTRDNNFDAACDDAAWSAIGYFQKHFADALIRREGAIAGELNDAIGEVMKRFIDLDCL
jgi:hypothetical protein